jgi:hypothetical protein
MLVHNEHLCHMNTAEVFHGTMFFLSDIYIYMGDEFQEQKIIIAFLIGTEYKCILYLQHITENLWTGISE